MDEQYAFVMDRYGRIKLKDIGDIYEGERILNDPLSIMAASAIDRTEKAKDLYSKEKSF